jgi:uncharacterized repeat protein (TIGR03803 family)
MSLSKFTRSFALFVVGLVTVQITSAQTYTVLYSFTGGTEGQGPFGTLIRDAAGNLYGTTIGGDEQNGQDGSVFKLNPKNKFKLLYNFASDGSDGEYPRAGLVQDAAGNLYGTTQEGGAYGSGTAFEVAKNGKFSVLHSFSGGADGFLPLGPLTLDSSGNLYGTTTFGGNPGCVSGSGCGVAFELNPAGEETVLRAFIDGKKGAAPEGGLIRDSAGNLFGTADGGGHNGHGTIFKLDPAGNQTALYTFMGKADGQFPGPGMIQDASGNFYGTAYGGVLAGGGSGAGVVFKLDASGNYTPLYTFTGKSDGFLPNGYLAMDPAGNLYGTTFYGGERDCSGGCGVVFKVDPTGQETVLHAFQGGTDGAFPVGGLVIDAAGILYGTASSGGNPNDCTPDNGCGLVFKITP